MRNLFFLFFALVSIVAKSQEARLVLPDGLSNSVMDAYLSSDNSKLIVSCADDVTKIYDYSSKKELMNIIGGGSVIDRKGKFIATYNMNPGNRKVRLYDAANSFEFKCEINCSAVSDLVFTNDATQLIVSDMNFDENTWESQYLLRIIDTKQGKQIDSIILEKQIFSLDVSYDNRYLAVMEASSTINNGTDIRIFELKTFKEVKKIVENCEYRYPDLCFSPDGKHLAVALCGNLIKIYDAQSFIEIADAKSQEEIIWSINYSPDSKYLVIASSDKTIKSYDPFTKKIKWIINADISMSSAISMTKDSKQIITGNHDKTVIVYDIVSGSKLKEFGNIAEMPGSFSLFKNDGNYALVYGSDLYIIQINTGKIIKKINNNTASLSAVSVSSDGSFILTGSIDSTISIIDYLSKIELFKFKDHKSPILSVDISPNMELIASTSDSTVNLYDVKKGKLLKSVTIHSGRIVTVEFTPDSKRLLTASWDLTAKILDLESLKVDKILEGHTWGVTSGCISKDGKLLATCSRDKSIRLYDALSGKIIRVFNGHEGIVNSIKFSQDGKKIISASWDKTIRIWDIQTGETLKILRGHVNFVLNASYTTDGKYILSTGSDHKTILWEAATGRALYTRLQLKNGDWLVYDEHYRYDGTQGARDYLYFVCGLEVVDLAQVKDALYVPNLVQRIMNGENLDHLPKLKDLEICGVSPEVEPIDNKKDGGSYYKITPRKGGVGYIEIYINGALRQTIDSKKLALVNGVYEIKLDEKFIAQHQTSERETEIKVIARTADNKISSRGAVAKTERENQIGYRKPNLHAVLVGIDDYKGEGLDLNYAAKDAIDLQKALETSSKKLFNIDDTNRVHFYNLSVDRAGKITGKTPDRNNILQAIEKIAKESKPEDVLLIFFAGHGEINKEKQLILLTADASKEQAPDYSGITMKELLEKLTTVPAGKRILLLDACHSGAAINELNLKDIAGVRNGEDAEKQSQRLKELENLASKSGLSIITASSSDQKAMELPQYEHGLMTYALLTTMMNEPNVLDKDNNLQIEDWLRETEKAVSRLIENQSAQRFVPINFSIGKVDEEVRKSVDLKEIPTIVVANVLNRNTDDDDLDVKSQLKKLLSETSSRSANDKILLAEKESSTAISVNITYEVVEGKIESRITLKKNKVVLKQFNFVGTENKLSDFVIGLNNEIIKNIKL
jgi:WD40 repeat protein/uncharacterized caspase-like protein